LRLGIAQGAFIPAEKSVAMTETTNTPWWQPAAQDTSSNGSTSGGERSDDTPRDTERTTDYGDGYGSDFGAPAQTSTQTQPVGTGFPSAPHQPYDPWSATAPISTTYGPATPPPGGSDGDQAGGSGGSGRGRRFARTAGGLALLLAVATAGGFIGAAVDNDNPSTAPAASSVTRDGSSVQPTSSTTGASIESAAKTISPSVVTIQVSGQEAGGFGQTQEVSGTGSGVIVRSDGYILTNNHVVEAAANGGSISVTFEDGSSAKATIVGRDPSNDLAVIKAEGKSGLKAATFADSDKLTIGQPVVAVGAPLGLSGTVTSGIVSSVQRPVRTGSDNADQQSAVIDAVQTDAAINPGNSGGPLVDLEGRVIGINSAIASVSQSVNGGQSGNIGVGFAIPANDAADVADQLIAKGYAEHAILGVGAQDAQSGAQIQNVTNGGPAASAGLQDGDVVTKVGDRQVFDVDSLIAAVRDHEPGEKVTVSYTRDGSTHTATVTLGAKKG
jgi:putative serine protease PepD